MGQVVSVWSSTKKTGKTLFLYMLVKSLSSILPKDVQILVGCVNLSYGNLANLFGVDKHELNFEDIVNFKIHPDNEFNLLNALAKRENVYFLGSKKTNSAYASRNMRIYENLIDEFKQTFDLILIDTISGNDNALTNMILDKSDHVLNVINQDKESLDRHSFITGKDIAFIINRYKSIYPNEKDISAIYGIDNIFSLPTCDKLQEMKNRDKLEYYIQHDTEYNSAILKISEFVAEKLDFDISSASAPEKRRHIFKGLLEGIL